MKYMRKLISFLCVFIFFAFNSMCLVNAKVIELQDTSACVDNELVITNADGGTIGISGLPEKGGLVSTESNDLPSYYSSKDLGYTTEIKDQYYTANCWAYSATSVFETFLKKNDLFEDPLSPLHMSYIQSSPNKDYNFISRPDWLCNGGRPEQALGYYISYKGAKTSYLENLNVININQELTSSLVSKYRDIAKDFDSNNKVLSSMDGFLYLNPNDKSNIKNAIKEYGAVGTTFICLDACFDNTYTNYYYDGKYPMSTGDGGHAIALVGWDDNYSKNNFSNSLQTTVPKNDGAWIAQNSWGTYVGDEGFFYISYEDTHIFDSNYGVTWCPTSSHKYSTYETLYDITPNCDSLQSYCPFTGKSSICYFNKFNFDNDEVIQNIYFEPYSNTATYKTYFVPINTDGKPKETNWTILSSGTIDCSGYYKSPVNNVKIPNGEGFICVEIIDGDQNNKIGAIKNYSNFFKLEKGTSGMCYAGYKSGSTLSIYDTWKQSSVLPIIKVQTTKNYIYGDANFDKQVTIADASKTQKHLANIEPITDEIAKLLANVNLDSSITISDTTLIQKYLANIQTDTKIGEFLKDN